MATTVPQVLIIASEFSEVDESTIEQFISWALDYVDASLWGSRFDYVHGLYTAHMMKLLGVGSTSGVSASGDIASEKLGPVQVNYSTAALGSSEQLSSTKYGSMIEQLKKTVLTSPIIIT